MQKNLITLIIVSSLGACSGGGGDSEDPQTPIDDPVNTAASFSGDLSGTASADGTVLSGNVVVTDPDSGEASVQAQTDTPTSFGIFNVAADGAWTFVANANDSTLIALGENETESDNVSILSADGTSQSISLTITGVNDIPIFTSGEGVSSASISNDIAEPVTGSIEVSDPDSNQSSFVAQTDSATSYGSFSITTEGNWTYTLDASNAAVSGLSSASDTLSDDISVSSMDGTIALISIAISGVDGPVLTGTDLIKGQIGDNDSVPDINCTSTFTSTSDLEDAVSDDMAAGTTFCLASGNYTGLDFRFGGTGTAEAPITVAAAVPGEVVIDGEVSINMAGEYVVLQGFIFKDGEMSNSLLQTRGNSNAPCHYCRVTENSFINMDEGQTNTTKWFQFYGTNNRFDHNWVSGKTTRGALFVVERGDDPGNEDRTQIDHNYFGDRPPNGGVAYADNSDNEYEGIRVGVSSTHTSDSFAVIEHNYFEKIDAEAEVISLKAGSITVRHNTIRNSRGSIVNRHGEGAVIDNNFVIGDGNPFSGGVRIVDANHVVTNNYIEGARNQSSGFYGGILISASDGSTSNGYQDVENVLVANNTVVDSVNSINLFAGNRDDNPESLYVINNIVADAIGSVFKNADELPLSSIYAGNYIYGQTFSDDDSVDSLDGFTWVDPVLVQDDAGIYRPSESSPDLSAVTTADTGDYSLPSKDMDGQNRSDQSVSGADESSEEEVAQTEVRGVLTAALVGPLSYTPPATTPYIQEVNIVNAEFDTQTLSGWSHASASITTEVDEVFSRGSSAVLSDNTDVLTQSVNIEANTNYTLSAFVAGTAKLSAIVGDVTYSGEDDSSGYDFVTVSFNSGDETSMQINASIDDLVLNYVDIVNPNFDDDQDNWVVNEGTGIGQVQDSDNSASGVNGSIKFTYNDGDSGDPYDPYIAQTVTVEPNTEYTLEMFILLKSSDEQDATVLFGVHTGQAIEGGVFTNESILASKNSVYADLSEDEEGDDSFRPDRIVFNSGDNTELTIFAQYQSTLGDDIRIDDFSMTSFGAPPSDAKAYFDSFRLVSHPSL